MGEYIVNVSNIPSQVDEYSLQQVMGHFGTVKSCKVVYGSSTQDPAKAWVEYATEKELESALKANGKLDCGGCTLLIKKWTGTIPDKLESKREIQESSSRKNFKESSTCQDSCWFCLSNRNCQTHMIAYISRHSYIAVSKGGLCDLHVLVVPIYHFINTAFAPRDVQRDMQLLVDAFIDVSLARGMGVIAFERYSPMNMKVAMHTQVQVIAVPLEEALKSFDYVEGCNKFSARRINIGPDDEASFNCLSSRITNVDQSYFYLQAVGHSRNSDEKQIAYSRCLWIAENDNNNRIPINLGREIAINLMNTEDILKLNVTNKHDALDWRNCKTTTNHETENANLIKRLILEL